MKTHWIVIWGILCCISLDGQTTKRLLILKDSVNNPLIGATITYFDSADKEIVSGCSDANGIVYLINDYNSLSVWLIGFQKVLFHSTEFKNDKNVKILKSVTYDCPNLIIRDDGTASIDSNNYIDKFVDKRILVIEDFRTDTIKNDYGSTTIKKPIPDTLRGQMDCKIATPKVGFIHYYGKISQTISLSKQDNCFDSRLLVVYFSVNWLGEMKISNLIGVKNGFKEMFANKIMDIWIPAKMWDIPINTNYRMRIKIE